jgi:gas vesicle protein
MLGKSDELRDRIEARKHELLAKYKELKADSRRDAADASTRVKARLDELETHLKNGWDKVSDDVRTKLNKWLDRRDD